jgi:hypothetical protein
MGRLEDITPNDTIERDFVKRRALFSASHGERYVVLGATRRGAI